MVEVTSDCPNCSGTGSIDKEACGTCNGTGHKPMSRQNKKPLYIS